MTGDWDYGAPNTRCVCARPRWERVWVAAVSGGAAEKLDPILQRLNDLGTTAMLLSGSPDEGQIVRRIKARPFPPGRAQVISRNRGLFTAQLAWVPPAYE